VPGLWAGASSSDGNKLVVASSFPGSDFNVPGGIYTSADGGEEVPLVVV